MKTYVVFDTHGNELGYVAAGSLAAAEKKARTKFAKTVPEPEKITVTPTEL